MQPDSAGFRQQASHGSLQSRVVEAIIQAGGELPVSLHGHMFSLHVRDALEIFHLAAPRVPRNPEHLRYARERIGVPEADVDAWYTQAWWGTRAARACKNRLRNPAREREVMDLVMPIDWTLLDDLVTRGRGLLLCGSHWGVPHVVSAFLHTMGRPAMQIGRGDMGHHFPGTDRSHAGSQAGLTRLYLQAFLRLRAGGVVALLPDGRGWREAVDEPFLGRPRLISLGPAALARLCNTPALPWLTVWDQDRIRIDFGKVLEPETGGGELADRRWTRAYLDWLEAMARAHPRSNRLDQLKPPAPPDRDSKI